MAQPALITLGLFTFIGTWSDFTWPLVVLSDDAARAVASPMNFLWTTFTRFEPANDIHAAGVEVDRSHLCYTPPIVIDATS